MGILAKVGVDAIEHLKSPAPHDRFFLVFPQALKNSSSPRKPSSPHKMLGPPYRSLVPRGTKHGWIFFNRVKQICLIKNAVKMM